MPKKDTSWSVGSDRYGLKDALWTYTCGVYIIVDLLDGTQTQAFTKVGKAMDYCDKLRARKYYEDDAAQ